MGTLASKASFLSQQKDLFSVVPNSLFSWGLTANTEFSPSSKAKHVSMGGAVRSFDMVWETLGLTCLLSRAFTPP